MKQRWYIVPMMNEGSVMVSMIPFNDFPQSWGPHSGCVINGQVIEDMSFDTKEEAADAVPVEWRP